MFSTVEHPFYANGHYTPAKELQAGDSVYTRSGTKEAVHSIQLIDTTAVVYNLEVEHQHNYFIGRTGLLVHNSCALKTIYSQITDQAQRNAFKSQLRAITSTTAERTAERERTTPCGYRIMEQLASVINSYPLQLDESGDIKTTDYVVALKTVREWFAKHPNYKIRRDRC